MKVSYIKWYDASGSAENIWQEDDQLSESLVVVQSAGLVISEDSDRVTIIHSKIPGGFMGDITIPKIGIISRKDFEIK